MVEWTITAAGAVVPNADGSTTTEPEISVARSGAGTYLLTIPSNFQKALNLMATYRAAAPSSIVANVTTVGLGTGVPQAGGGATTNVTVVTGNSNAVPAAADQAAGIVGFRGQFVRHKI
jgi:hypothetical protein